MASDVSDDERMRARERPAGRPVMRQIWRHLAFLHWPVARDAIARAAAARPGRRHLRRRRVRRHRARSRSRSRAPAASALPMAPAFHEINLRTYVHRGGRDPGVWFFSLDATSRLAVAGARLAYGLPYFHADITLGGDGRAPSTTARAGAVRRRAFAARYQPTGPVAPAAPGIARVLPGRALPAVRARRTRPAHRPRPPHAVSAAARDRRRRRADADERRRAAPPAPGPPPLVHYAREVDVAIFGPAPPRLDNPRPVR